MDASEVVRAAQAREPHRRRKPEPSTPAVAADTRFVAGIGEFAERYELWLVDQWGVLHDGRAPFPGVVDCLRRLDREGKKVVLLSNSGRRVEPNILRLAEIGIGPELYTAMITSGELARMKMAARTAPFSRGRRCLAVGGDGGIGLLDGTGIERVTTVAEADFVLLAGVDDAMNEGDYEVLLESAAVRGLPLVCANPDLVRFTERGMMPSSGDYARRYECLGGTVHYLGKPHPEIYDYCLALYGPADRSRIVAVGDSLYHDVCGGSGARLATAFVTGGIHRGEFAAVHGEPQQRERLGELSRDFAAAPDWAVPLFCW